MRYTVGITLLFFLFPIFPTFAQTGEEQTREEILDRLTLLLDEAQSRLLEKNWSAALDRYKKAQDILNDHPDIFENRQVYEERKQHVIFHIGLCHYYLAASGGGNFEQHYQSAVEHFKRITELVVEKDRQYYHGESYYYLARVTILKGETPETIERVKEYLKKAKQHGFNVFLGIREDPKLKFLAEDPKFFLELLQTPSFLNLDDLEKVEDPFRIKVEIIREPKNQGEISDFGVPEAPVAGVETTDPKAQRELLKEIQTTFKKLKQALKKSKKEDKPSEEVILLWKRFQELMNRKDDIMLPSYKEQLKEIQRDYSLMEDQLEKVQLAYYYQQGKSLVDRMREAFIKKHYTTVLNLWRELFQLAQEMSQFPNPDFKRTADSLLMSGQGFEKQARIYLRLRNIPHKVTGIVIQTFPKQVRVAFVNHRPYREGEEVTDEEGNPLGLRIKKIEQGKVVFVYQGVEVESLLKEE